MGKKAKKTGMVTKTVNFEEWVLNALEKQARADQTSVSKIVNFCMRGVMLNNVSYARYMAKYHLVEFQRWKLVKEDLEELDAE